MKTVFAKSFDLSVNGLGKLACVLPGEHAVDQLVAQMADTALAFPGRHRTPQLVGFAGRESGGDNGQLHHLLLKNRHAERAFEHRAHRHRAGSSAQGALHDPASAQA